MAGAAAGAAFERGLDDALEAARALPALDRRPDGGALATHRLIVDAEGLWLVPRMLVARRAPPSAWLTRAVDWPGPPLPDPALYWLAHAARQRAWRAAARVPGPGPVVRLAIAGPSSAWLGVAMPGLPGRPAPPGLPRRFATAFGHAALRRDAAWAARRGGAADRASPDRPHDRPAAP